MPEDQSSEPLFGYSDSDTRGKHSKWFVFPWRNVLRGLIGLLALAAIVGAGVGTTLGWKAYAKRAHPHSSIHAKPKGAESQVVRPYFAPVKFGGVAQTGELVATLWFREGVPEPISTETDSWNHGYGPKQWYESMRSSVTGEQGYVVEEEGKKNDWEAVWTGDIPELGIEETKRVSNRVSLQGRYIHSLATNPKSLLIATYGFRPITSTSRNTGTRYTLNSTRTVDRYGPSKPWPLPFPADEVRTPLDSFFAHSAVGAGLHVRVEDYSAMEYIYNSSASMEEERQQREASIKYINFIDTKSLIVIARDYPSYRLDGFMDKMDKLADSKRNCASIGMFNPYECMRQFSHDGHFENLLSITEDGSETKWRYGPYLTSSLSPFKKSDYLRLPGKEDVGHLDPRDVPPFEFDWQVTFSSAAPAAMSLNRDQYPGGSAWRLLDNSSRPGEEYDNYQWRSALLGLTLDPESRPIHRGVISMLATGLRWLALPLLFHYWATRKVSTGIAIVTLSLETLVDLVHYIVTRALNFDYVSIPIFILAIIAYVLIILKQIHLVIKPDFKLATVAVGDVKVPAPVAVRFRSATVEEKASYKLDGGFDWRLRILVTLGTFLALWFVPVPHIVTAPSYENMIHGFGGASHWDPKALWVLHLFNTIKASIWMISRLSQIHLNFRSKTFGGSYNIVAYLLFGSLLLSHITKIFIGWFGRAQVMQPFTAWDVFSLIVSAGLAVQAATLPAVRQDVSEALD